MEFSSDLSRPLTFSREIGSGTCAFLGNILCIRLYGVELVHGWGKMRFIGPLEGAFCSEHRRKMVSTQLCGPKISVCIRIIIQRSS